MTKVTRLLLPFLIGLLGRQRRHHRLIFSVQHLGSQEKLNFRQLCTSHQGAACVEESEQLSSRADAR